MHMHIGDVYAITALVSTLLIGLVYGRMRQARIRMAIEPAFMHMLRFFIAFTLVDALWGLCYAGRIASPAFFTAVGYGYHALGSASAFVWMLYVLQHVRHRERLHWAFMGAAFLLLLAQLSIIASNPLHHRVFDVDGNGAYAIHELRLVLYGLQLAYYAIILLAGGVLSRCDAPAFRKRHRTAVVYSLGPALFCVGQYVFYDVAMYSLGFAYVALLICLYRQSSRIEKLRQEQFGSISREQLAIIRSLTDSHLAICYADVRTGRYDRFVRADTAIGLEVSRHEDRDFFREAAEWGRRNVADEDLERFLLVMDRDNVVRTLARQPEILMILKLRRGDGFAYHEGRITRPRDEADSDRIIVAIRDIDAQHRSQQQQAEELARALDQKTALEKEAGLLDLAAHRDIMTGLFNRRAHEDHTQEMGGMPDAADFVYVSLDVNGLKAVNDDLGHDAGDELIKGAAMCMKRCFADFGRVYRHGGDEFSAILHVDAGGLEGLFGRFEQTVAEWRGRLVDSLAVSFGHASAGEHPGASIEELGRIADQRMYECKERFYARKGLDRRAQQEAYEALRESYAKVLKVDLAADSFVVIKTDEREMDARVGFCDRFSEWMSSFARSGHIHESDMEEYLQKTRLDYIRDIFDGPDAGLAFRYRRRTEEGFRETMMEIIPARNYGPDNRIAFLYVKGVGGDGLYMRLHELDAGAEISVQMLWERDVLEFRSAVVGKDGNGLLIGPYMRGGHAVALDVLVTDDIRCNILARPGGGRRVMWHDVELRTAKDSGDVLYHVSTRNFNQYSRPCGGHFHRSMTRIVPARVTDITRAATDVVLRDVSDTGLSFHAAAPIALASDIVGIAFSDTVGGESFDISVTAKVVRSHAGRDGMLYGCLMIDPPADYRLYVLLHRLDAGHARMAEIR